MRVGNGCVLQLESLTFASAMFAVLFCFHGHSRLDGMCVLCRIRTRLGKIRVMLLPSCRPRVADPVSIRIRVKHRSLTSFDLVLFCSLRYGWVPTYEWIAL